MDRTHWILALLQEQLQYYNISLSHNYGEKLHCIYIKPNYQVNLLWGLGNFGLATNCVPL